VKGFLLIFLFSSLAIANDMQIGFEGGSGGLNNLPYGVTATNPSGVGLLGDYQIDRKISIEGNVFISNYNLSINTLNYNAWYGYSYYTSQVSVNQIDVSVGPKYRLLKAKLSPVVGLDLDYAHRQFSTQYYNYGISIPNMPSDLLSLGGSVGLNWRVEKDFSVEVDVDQMFNQQGSYYLGTAGVRFSF
jgi:hypothetical protein